MPRPLAYFARLLKLCRRQGRSRQDAEDLLQEAFLRLHEYRRGSAVRNEEAFLARTVANLAIDQYRRDRIVSYATQSLEELEGSAPLIDAGPTPERALAAQQRLAEITRALSAVSHKTCEIFLAQRAGYSYEEIAADLRISQRTVQKHIARAMFLLMQRREPE
jgi:RNA polymerase sigma-70 factor (ECF subfamily)